MIKEFIRMDIHTHERERERERERGLVTNTTIKKHHEKLEMDWREENLKALDKGLGQTWWSEFIF